MIVTRPNGRARVENRTVAVAGVIAALAILAGFALVAAEPGSPGPERRPWRFKEFPIIAWWGPPGTAGQEAFETYRDAGFTLHATNPDEGFDQALGHVEA